MSESREPVVRILAYIVRTYWVRDVFAEFNDGPNYFKGFILDVTVEVTSGFGENKRRALLDHLGDGKFYPTFEEARDVVAREMGFVMEKIPEEQWAEVPKGGRFEERIACYVREFKATDRPRTEIESECSLPPPDLKAKWDRYGGGLGDPEEPEKHNPI